MSDNPPVSWLEGLVNLFFGLVLFCIIGGALLMIWSHELRVQRIERELKLPPLSEKADT